ncbi:MAG: histidine phosphatase family protein [Clostridia bacterium]|nr:histidine phosphatase family protein [Clostridia bacterium]
MKFYITRHGETEWNAQNRICGRTDIPLTEKGLAQAHELGRRMKNEGKIPDLMVVSPMIRARQTAEAIREEIGEVEMIIDERIIEQNYGIYEGMDRGTEGFLRNKSQFAVKYPGGESQIQVAARGYNLIDELREKYPNRNIQLICHGGVCRILSTYFTDTDNDAFWRWSAQNCCLLEFDI